MIEDSGGVNQTMGLAEKLRVESVDDILVVLTRSADKVISGLVGRTFDLKTAYKQFGVGLEQQTLRIA